MLRLCGGIYTWLSYSGCNWLRLGVTWVAHYPPFICRLSADGRAFTAFMIFFISEKIRATTPTKGMIAQILKESTI